MEGKKTIREVILLVVAAAVLTLLTGLGALQGIDRAACDLWYQSRSASDGDIVLVGIDQQALEEIGPYQKWGRDVIAQVIQTLNKAENCRPAVIGVDVLYAGETDAQADLWLAEAAGEYGNVVMACSAEIGSALVEGANGEYYMDPFVVQSFDEPFEALKKVTTQGHINAMMDTDGILRHHMLWLTLSDGRQVPSLALAIANLFQEYQGLGPVELPSTDSHGFWYVPFCGRPGDFDESISVADVLSGAISADFFADRIVLIGPYATGLQDSYLTSIDHARPMYGVEFQANAVQALLWGEYKSEVMDGVQLAVLFVLLILGSLGFWRRHMIVSTGLWIALCGGWLLLCKGLYRQGVVLHVLWVPVGISILYAACLAGNYIQAAKERRLVREKFNHYVAPEIVNEILKQGTNFQALLEAGGKKTHIAVLFVDIRGFTSMSERLDDPEKVVPILNRYLTLIAQCILDHGGTLDKFVGDAAMAFWGAPMPQEDYVMNAVKAAADMVKRAEPLSQALMQEFGQSVTFGVGVHVGEAVVGNMGSPKHMDYTAIGDTVNTAARLEANAPGGTIYISRAVADCLEGRIATTSLKDQVKLKGKMEGFEVLTMDKILDQSFEKA